MKIRWRPPIVLGIAWWRGRVHFCDIKADLEGSGPKPNDCGEDFADECQNLHGASMPNDLGQARRLVTPENSEAQPGAACTKWLGSGACSFQWYQPVSYCVSLRKAYDKTSPLSRIARS